MKKTFWATICLLMYVLPVSAESSWVCADKSAASVLLSRDSRKVGEGKKGLMKATYNAVDSFCRTLAGGVKAGYAGFVDASILATMTGESAVSVSTTHGYCFNPFVFVGAGLACDVYRDALCAIVGWLLMSVYVWVSLPERKTVRLGRWGHIARRHWVCDLL